VGLGGAHELAPQRLRVRAHELRQASRASVDDACECLRGLARVHADPVGQERHLLVQRRRARTHPVIQELQLLAEPGHARSIVASTRLLISSSRVVIEWTCVSVEPASWPIASTPC
jgi:hypothetical protein